MAGKAAKVMKIELVNAGVTLDDREIFSSVNASFTDGDLVLVTGSPSGGKTALFDVLRMKRELDLGDMLVDGRDLRENTRIRKYYSSLLGILPEAGIYSQSSLLDKMVEANRSLARDLSRVDYDRRLDEGTKYFRLELADSMLLGQLSRSEKTRFLLMLEMIRSPHVLLLDSVLSDAGTLWGERIFLLCRRLCDDGMIAVIMEREIPIYLGKRVSRHVEDTGPFRLYTFFRKEVTV